MVHDEEALIAWLRRSCEMPHDELVSLSRTEAMCVALEVVGKCTYLTEQTKKDLGHAKEAVVTVI